MALTACRECGREVSTAASACPHCGVPDPSGATLQSGACGGCGKEIVVASHELCPHCGVKDPHVPYQVLLARGEATRSRSGLEVEAILALVAACILFVGVFLPALHIPLSGPVNYFQNGRGDGVLIIVLAVAAATLA